MSDSAALMSTDRKNLVAGIVQDAGERLRRFIRARVPSDADAQDVLQDVWQRLVAAMENEPIESVTSWLYTVARNRIIDRYRKPAPASLDALGEEQGEDDATLGLPDWLLRDEHTPEFERSRTLFWRTLHDALGELPAEQRQAFVWHELEGLSFEDMVRLTGENKNTLLSRKRYAVLHLRRRFAALRDEFTPLFNT